MTLRHASTGTVSVATWKALSNFNSILYSNIMVKIIQQMPIDLISKFLVCAVNMPLNAHSKIRVTKYYQIQSTKYIKCMQSVIHSSEIRRFDPFLIWIFHLMVFWFLLSWPACRPGWHSGLAAHRAVAALVATKLAAGFEYSSLISRLTFAVFGRKLKKEKKKMNSSMNTTLDTTFTTTTSQARSSISALSDAESARNFCVST